LAAAVTAPTIPRYPLPASFISFAWPAPETRNGHVGYPPDSRPDVLPLQSACRVVDAQFLNSEQGIPCPANDPVHRDSAYGLVSQWRRTRTADATRASCFASKARRPEKAFRGVAQVEKAKRRLDQAIERPRVMPKPKLDALATSHLTAENGCWLNRAISKRRHEGDHGMTGATDALHLDRHTSNATGICTTERNIVVASDLASGPDKVNREPVAKTLFVNPPPALRLPWEGCAFAKRKRRPNGRAAIFAGRNGRRDARAPRPDAAIRRRRKGRFAVLVRYREPPLGGCSTLPKSSARGRGLLRLGRPQHGGSQPVRPEADRRSAMSGSSCRRYGGRVSDTPS